MIFERTGKIFIGRFASFLGIEGLIHGISLRKGGVSCPPFDSLNTGTGTGDDPVFEKKNKQLFLDSAGIQRNMFAVPVQIHGDSVQTVREPGVFAETDALITDRPGLFLSVQTADCVPVFLVDPVNKTSALVHAGWRGSALDIVSKTIDKMRNETGVDPKNLLAGIGPAIGVCCYEVGGEVLEHFDPAYHLNGHLDLTKFNFDALVQSGIPEKQIESCGLCTACNSFLFFSYRYSGGQTGRMMSVIGFTFKKT